MHLPRLRTLAIPAMGALTTLMAAAGHAHAADIDPVGIGDLMPSPSSSVPAGQGTLYETYSNSALWQLDSDYGRWDVLDPMIEIIADVCMMLITVLGTACVVLVQWLFQLTSLPELQDALTGSIGGVANVVSTTWFPAALAVGGFIAFTQQRDGGGGGGMSQLAWVFVSGVVSVSLLSTPQVWVDGVDTTRQAGASIAMEATAGGIGSGDPDFPFALDHKPKYTGSGRDDLLRKSADATWRTYVAAPWCLAEFGSFEACEKHGRQLLDQGTSRDDRKEWLQDNVTEDSVGRDSVTWRQGHTPLGRVGVTIPALICIAIFTILVISLAFASLMSLLGAMMLLVAGPVFACLWVIPGRTRQWGLKWFDQLVGLTLQSFIATMVLGCVLIIQVATTQMFGVYGWAPSVGLSIAAAIVAVRFRKIMEGIVGVSGTMSSPVGGIMGLMALRSAGRLLTRGGKGGQHNAPVRTLPKPRGGDGPGAPDTGAPGGPPDSGTTLARITTRPPAPPPLPLETAERRALDAPAPAAVIPPRTPPRALAPAAATAIPAAATATLERIDTAPSAPRPASSPARPLEPRTPGTDPKGLPSPDASSAHPYWQAPPPGEPARAPRVIEARVIRSTPNPPPTAHRPPVTQPPPPPARRPRPELPAPRPPRGDTPSRDE
ncbi:hypothetical protein AB0918_18775 [Streptomyces sp. NPDC006864]|uniref:hypothetical protein n=1 Tax=Streptomyces sp. NPDC006864 TaxID=3154780 RepID=UPI003453266F